MKITQPMHGHYSKTNQLLLEIKRLIQRNEITDDEGLWFDPFSTSGIWKKPLWEVKTFLRTPLPEDISFNCPDKGAWGVLPIDLQYSSFNTKTIEKIVSIACEEAWPGLILYRPDDELIAGIANIESLKFLCLLEAMDVSEAGLGKLNRLNLLQFVYDSYQASDNLAQVITQWPNLEMVSISGRGLSDDGLSRLAGLTSLRSLSICCPDVTDTGLNALVDLPLVALDLSGCQNVTGSSLGSIKTLCELDLGNTGITPGNLSLISKQSRLKHLELTTSGWETFDTLSDLSQLENLTSLQIAWAYPDSLEFITPLKNLKRLSLNDSSISGKLAPVGELDRLEELTLANVKIRDNDLEPLEQLTKLRALDLKSSQVTGIGLKHFPMLERLNLYNCISISEDGLSKVVMLPQLEQLNLSECFFAYGRDQAGGLTDAAVAHLAKCTTLRRLSMEGNLISPSTVNTLRSSLPECIISASYMVPTPIVKSIDIGIKEVEFGNLDSAQAELNKAYAQYENYPPTLTALAQLYTKQNDITQALVMAGKAANIDASIENLIHYAKLLIEIKQQKDAIKVLTRILQNNPNYIEAYLWRAESQYDTGDLVNAVRDYTEAINRCAQGESDATFWANWAAILYTNRGSARFETRDINGAIADFDRAIALESTEPHIFANRAEALEKNKSFEKAINDYTTAIEKAPDNSDYWKGRARCRISLKKFDEARSDLKKALLLNPDDREINQMNLDFS